MPIYQYRCFSCGEAFDALVRRPGVEKAKPCPKGCKTEKPPEKQVSAPAGFDLKGIGWYSKGNA